MPFRKGNSQPFLLLAMNDKTGFTVSEQRYKERRMTAGKGGNSDGLNRKRAF
jgi:hypothetical protein